MYGTEGVDYFKKNPDGIAAWWTVDEKWGSGTAYVAHFNILSGATVQGFDPIAALTDVALALAFGLARDRTAMRTADEFLFGRSLLVAPVVEKGAKTREVVIPPGMWTADDGSVHTGPATITVATPLERLPYFIKQVGGK